MSTDFHGFVLRNCQELGFPCIPDVADPIVSVHYIAKAWCGVEGNSQVAAYVNAAESKGLVVCKIRRHACIRLSAAGQLVVEE